MAHLKNEFTEDEKCHDLISWLISVQGVVGLSLGDGYRGLLLILVMVYKMSDVLAAGARWTLTLFLSEHCCRILMNMCLESKQCYSGETGIFSSSTQISGRLCVSWLND